MPDSSTELKLAPSASGTGPESQNGNANDGAVYVEKF